MEYISVKEWAERQEIAKRTARNYCAQGKIKGAVLIGKTWNIPIDTALPERKKAQSVSPLLKVLREQKTQMKGGIYHRIQIDFTYNSNHIEGSRLTHDQTRYIFETNTIGVTDEAINVDDIIETTNISCRRLHHPRERLQTYRNLHQTAPPYFEIRNI